MDCRDVCVRSVEIGSVICSIISCDRVCIHFLKHSLKDFICDSSEEDEESANLHRRVNCLIDRDSPWRE